MEKTIMIIVGYLLIYLMQVLLCAAYHSIKGTRQPTGMGDLLKLTFAPYVIYKLIKQEAL